MKRDTDLIRSILLEIENCQDPQGANEIEIEGYSAAEVNYHIGLLCKAGMVESHQIALLDLPGGIYLNNNLTMEGHEFLDAARNDTVWNNSKEAAQKYGGSVPLELLKGLLMKAASAYLGLP